MRDYFLEVRNLTKHFPLNNDLISRLGGRNSTLKAVDDISFFIKPGETLGLVGESGCGKSTTARLITRLIEPSGGSIYLNGEDLLSFPPERMLEVRKTVQLVFQDPYSSLNPRKTIMQILSRPLEVHSLAKGWTAKRRHVLHLLRLVGLGVEHADRYPHEFSGGQRQRIAIARALAVSPQLIIGDEPVSALDVSIQAQILNLFRELQEEFNLTYLFIAHDLSVIRHISDRVAVMYVGKIVETGTVETIFENPKHPYTHALLMAVPHADPLKPPPRLTAAGANWANPPSTRPPAAACTAGARSPPTYAARCRRSWSTAAPTTTWRAITSSRDAPGPIGSIFLDEDLVGNGPGFFVFPAIHLEFDGARFSLASYSPEAAPPAHVAGLLDAELQGVDEKPEGIEQRTLSHPVLADDRGHGGKRRAFRLTPQAPHRHVLEPLEILDPEAFDPGHPEVPIAHYVGAFYTTASRRRGKGVKILGTLLPDRTRSGAPPPVPEPSVHPRTSAIGCAGQPTAQNRLP